MAAPDRKPVLIVLHQEHSTPGRVGLRLAARGHRLDIRRPRFGDPLPETLANHAADVREHMAGYRDRTTGSAGGGREEGSP